MSSAFRQSDPPAKAHRVPLPSSKRSTGSNAVEEPPADVDVARELQEIDAELAQEADLILDGPINEFASDLNEPDRAVSVESAEPAIADEVDKSSEAVVAQSLDEADNEDAGKKPPVAAQESEAEAVEAEAEAEAVADVASSGSQTQEPATSAPSVEHSSGAPTAEVTTNAPNDPAPEEKPAEPTAEDRPEQPVVTAKSPPEQVGSVDPVPQEANRPVEQTTPSAESAWWIPIVKMLRAICRGASAMGFKLLVMMSYPVQLLPDRAKTIFSWFALSLLLWVPAMWVIAHFLSNRG